MLIAQIGAAPWRSAPPRKGTVAAVDSSAHRAGTRLVPWLILGLASVHGTAALAEAWLIQPTVEFATQYEDNIRLVPDEQESAWTYIPTLQGLVSRQTETMDVRALGRFSYRIYEGETDLEDTGQILARLGSEFRTERSFFQLDGAWRRDDTFSNRDNFDPDLPGDIADDEADTRATAVQAIRNRGDIVPRYRYRLSERTTVGATFAYRQQYYEDDEVDLDFSEYKQYTYSLDHSYAVDERTRWTNRVRYVDYEAPNRDRQYQTQEFLTGIERSFTERFSAGLDVGWRETDFDTPTDEGTNDGYSLILTGRFRDELWLLRGRISHRLVPSSSGDVVEQDEIVVDYAYSLTPRLAARLEARYFENESLLVENERTNRSYMYIEPSLSYALSLAWSLRASLFHEREDREIFDESAENTGVMFSISWRPPSELD